MLLRYFALVDGSVKVKFVPLVAPSDLVTYQPLGSPNVTLVKLVQSAKADEPMAVTLLPIVTLANLKQESKAHKSMVVTLSGMTMLVKLVQPRKA